MRIPRRNLESAVKNRLNLFNNVNVTLTKVYPTLTGDFDEKH